MPDELPLSAAEPPWLISMVDQRMALVEEHYVAEMHASNVFTSQALGAKTSILMLLVEPDPDSPLTSEEWERTCDRCGTYTGPGLPFYLGTVRRTLSTGDPVRIVVGTCEQHKF